MKVRKGGALIMALLMVAGLFTNSFRPAFADAKRRIAVMPFEVGSVGTEVSTADVSKGVTSALITHLVNDGTYKVVDRQMMDAILKEQNFSNSDRADPTTAAKIGKILGVDAIITGTISQFGFESKSSGGTLPTYGTGYIPYVGGFLGGIGGRSNKGTCHVAIEARLIDTNTMEVLAAGTGDGKSLRKSGGMSLAGMSYDEGSGGFSSAIAGEATMQAVKQLADIFVGAAAKIPDNQSLIAKNVEGKIADVTGKTVILNVGKRNGVAPGDNYQVERVYKTVKDPTSGRVLKELTNTVAIIHIDSAEPEMATGTLTKGIAAVGDTVKKVTTDVSAVILNAK
jgi:curli biogenesis system outer membrane secretion channel CsgG